MPATVFVSFRSSSRYKVALSLNFRPMEAKLIPSNHEIKLPRASSLPIRIICGKGGWRRQNLVYAPHRWASRSMPPRSLELISHYDRRSEKHEEESKSGDVPLLNVEWPAGTSKIIGPLLSASSTHVWLQKWEWAILGAWRHIKQRFSPTLHG